MSISRPAKKKYRRDIDGLRAIAVLSVFLYHLHPQLLPGGFLGVDVFFVISGYLITAIIVREHHLHCFSFAHFYARRVKRIFPALFVVLLLSACVAVVLMTPEAYVTFMQSGRYAAAQLSNFFFSRKIDYFSEGFSGQPLLHTWSLGVEEQFYLFWPLLILVCFRFFRNHNTVRLSNSQPIGASQRSLDSPGIIENLSGTHHTDSRIAAIFIVLAAVSFWICFRFTESSYNLAFYMFYTRAFEFCIGGFLALKIVPELKSDRANILAGATGLLLLCYSFLFISEEFLGGSFLQFGVLVPCIGSAIIIHVQSKKSIAHRLISKGFPVYVGKISYSLYLYHWPVIIFWKLFSNNHSLGWTESVGIILVSFLLATLSFFLVEQPVRKSKLANWKTILLAIGVIIVFAYSFRTLEDFGESEWRITRYQQDRPGKSHKPVEGCRKSMKDGIMFYQCQDTRIEDTAIVALLGDSHAPHYFKSVSSWAKKEGYNVKYIAVPGCPMVLGDVSIQQTIFDEEYTKSCEDSLALLQKSIVDDPLVEIVMIAQRFDLFYDGKGYLNNTRIITFRDPAGSVVDDHTRYYEDRLSETVETMKAAGKKVIILKQVPLNIGTDSCDWEPLLIGLFNQEKRCEYDDGFIAKWQKPSINFVNNFCRNHELSMFDPALALDKPQQNDKNLYTDGDHLNEYGVDYLVPYFEQYMDRIMAATKPSPDNRRP